MTEIRDPYTARHQDEVARLRRAIATRMQLATSLVTLIGRAGEVHDIDEVAIPAEILTRPGRLNTNALELIRTDYSVGYDILSSAHLPWPNPEVAYQHHRVATIEQHDAREPGSSPSTTTGAASRHDTASGTCEFSHRNTTHITHPVHRARRWVRFTVDRVGTALRVIAGSLKYEESP